MWSHKVREAILKREKIAPTGVFNPAPNDGQVLPDGDVLLLGRGV